MDTGHGATTKRTTKGEHRSTHAQNKQGWTYTADISRKINKKRDHEPAPKQSEGGMEEGEKHGINIYRTSRLAVATAAGSPEMVTSTTAFSPVPPSTMSMVVFVLSLSLSMLASPLASSLLTTSGGSLTTARRARSSLTLNEWRLQTFPSHGGGGGVSEGRTHSEQTRGESRFSLTTAAAQFWCTICAGRVAVCACGFFGCYNNNRQDKEKTR